MKERDPPEAVTRKVDRDPAQSLLIDNEITVCPHGRTIDVSTIPPLAFLEVVKTGEGVSTHRLYGGMSYRIGTGPDVHIPIRDPGVSSHHATITPMEGNGKVSIWIEDCGYPGGTLVNGSRITRHEIQPADEIRIGGAELRCKLLLS